MKSCKTFDIPMQVMFLWHDNGDNSIRAIGGIAYGDNIICGCCGGIIPLDDEDVIDVIPYKSWIDISESILGEEINNPLT